MAHLSVVTAAVCSMLFGAVGSREPLGPPVALKAKARAEAKPVARADKAKTERPAPSREIWAATWKPVPAACGMLTHMMFLEGEFSVARRSALPDPATFAARSRALPQGRAAIQWWRYSNSLFAPHLDAQALAPSLSRTSTHHPWDTVAVEAVAAEWRTWLADFRHAGGRLDVLVGDCERWGIFSSWSLDATAVQRITRDPRMHQSVFGVPSLSLMLAGVDLGKVTSYQSTNDYIGWNQAIGTLATAAMRQAVWAPAQAAFPNARGSNFGGMRMLHGPAPDLNGHPQSADNVFATASAPVCYGSIEGASTAWFIDPADPTRLSKSGTTRIQRSAWFSFLFDQQTARACRRTSPEIPLHPWIALQAWPGDKPDLVGYPKDQRYHDEMVRHLALMGAETFLYWNPEKMPESSGGGQAPWTAADHAACAQRLNEVLREVNARTGGVVASTQTREAIRFDAAMVTSGALRKDGRWVWRTTVRDDVIELRSVRNGAGVPLEHNSRGRWDVTDTPVPPAYTAHTRADGAPSRRK